MIAARILNIRDDTGKTTAGIAFEDDSKVGPGVGKAGGELAIFNKSGSEIVQGPAAEYGNGVVGAYNSKGKGPTRNQGHSKQAGLSL
jgi:hypothetical protein